MSVPFSNTNLRIPRGFGNLLEGLAKEVLRDQPEDIPTFAACYFSELLKAREESGLDPADWGARLEDRFYNNHPFKVQETATTQGSFGSSKANTSSSAGEIKTFGNNGTQQSKELNASDNLDEIEVKKKFELDEESGEAEHGPTAEISYVRRTDVDIRAEEVSDPSEFPEQVSENTDILRGNKTENNTDICRSELDPTPLPSFGGLANVDVCAEEINPPLTDSEYTEDNIGPESQDVQNLPDSFIESPSLIDHDIGKQADEMSDDENTEEAESYDHIKESEQEVSEITFLDDTGLEKESTEKVYLEESTEENNALDMTETRITNTTEAGTGELIEEREELLDSEDQEVNENSSTNDIVDDEPAAETTEINDTYIVYSDETYDSKSEIIDVLDEVVMGGEHEARDNTDEHSSSKIIDALEEEELLEIQSHTQEPDYQLSDTEVTEDVMGKEVLNTDVMDTSEKDPITETINEASDLDSYSEEMDQDDVGKVEEDQTKSTTFDDLSSMREQDVVTTDDVTDDSEVKEDVLASETEKEAEITDEHHVEAREQSEHLETDEDQGDQFGDQEDEKHASNLDSENQEKPEISEAKEECNQPNEEEDIMDIPLDDPEANKAAAKIQAGFRGHMTRKKMKPGEKTGDEVSSSGEALNGSEGDTAGGTDGVETDTTSGPEQ